MSNIKVLFLAIVFVFTTSVSTNLVAAEDEGGMPPKVKAFLLVSGYGTVGGALLGFASMAFGTNSRAIAQGASLGLYAGMLFGGYVILTHKKPGSEVDAEGIEDDGYGDEDGYGGDGFDGEEGGEEEGFYGQRYEAIYGDIKKGDDYSPPIYFNLINMTF